MAAVIRVFVEKKPGFDVEAQHIKAEIVKNLGIHSIEELRLLHRYDVEGLSEGEFQSACKTVFSEPNVDNVLSEDYTFPAEVSMTSWQSLPQYVCSFCHTVSVRRLPAPEFLR